MKLFGGHADVQDPVKLAALINAAMQQQPSIVAAFLQQRVNSADANAAEVRVITARHRSHTLRCHHRRCSRLPTSTDHRPSIQPRVAPPGHVTTGCASQPRDHGLRLPAAWPRVASPGHAYGAAPIGTRRPPPARAQFPIPTRRRRPLRRCRSLGRSSRSVSRHCSATSTA